MNRYAPVHSHVYVNMESTPSYAVVTKDSGYSVLILFKKCELHILGGKDWDILKFYACEASSSHAYPRFMQLIGKMCKKSELHGEANYVSLYFSDAAGYTAEDGAFRPWEDAAHLTAELLSAAQTIRSHFLSREENHA